MQIRQRKYAKQICKYANMNYSHESNAEWSSNRTPANYFSVYVYASHFILGVIIPDHLILGVLATFSGV